MYEELDTFERALQHFGTRVEVIAAMEMGCLLYTSPSPRDVEEARMPSSA